MSLTVLPVQVNGAFSECTYFVIDENTRRGVVIDPGAEPDKLLDIIRRNGIEIERILLTHGHVDHIGAVDPLREILEIDVYSYSNQYLLSPYLNLSESVGHPFVVRGSHEIKNREKVPVDKTELEVIYTPGHTPESVIFHFPSERFAIVGDTIYQGGPGLTSFPGGDEAVLMHTIQDKIMTLPDDTILYSGHAGPIRKIDLHV